MVGNGSVTIACKEGRRGSGSEAASLDGRRMAGRTSLTTMRGTYSSWRGGIDIPLKLEGHHPPLPVSEET